MIPPPHERPSAAELVAGSGAEPVCPGCGAVLFSYKTMQGKYVIKRYEQCRTPGCDRRFITRQPHREIVREVGSCDENLSSNGKSASHLDSESG